MKILVDTDNCSFQNTAGGVRTKITNHYTHLSQYEDVKLFDKWSDKIDDYDILHIFRASTDELNTVSLAKSKHVPVILSAIIPNGSRLKVKYSIALKKILKLDSHYYNLFKLFSLVDIIIAETIYEKQNIIDCYGVKENKVVVIPNGVCTDQQSDDGQLFRAKTGLKRNDKIVLQVGRFDPNKNQLSVIRAAKGMNATIVFIGGPDKNNIAYFDKCKQEAGDNVLFLGWVDHQDPLLYSSYAAAHSLILPSHKEIFGNVLFEASLYNTNLILTDVLPIAEWGFSEYCDIVNPDSIQDIKSKIELSLKRPKSGEIGTLVRDNFSWESVIEKHLRLYKDLLNEK